jgi:hypothetical protein
MSRPPSLPHPLSPHHTHTHTHTPFPRSCPQEMNITQSNVTAASAWLHAMDDAAASLGLTIQLCMPLPIHMLESTTMGTVTNARASGDYHPGQDNWFVFHSSVFYDAIGVQPSKDDFWTTMTQPGNPYGDNPSEPNWQMQAIVATLSTGPVGPSDMVGATNVTVVMQTCRAGDGLLLRPDVPLKTPDSAFTVAVWGGAGGGVWRPDAPRVPGVAGDGDFVYAVGATGVNEGAVPDVGLSHSAHAHGAWKWFYLLGVRLEADFTMAWADLGDVGAATTYAAFEWFSFSGGPSQVFNASSPYVLTKGGSQPSAPARAYPIRYHVLAPVFPSGWVLLGEMGKIASMSRMRTSELAVTPAGFNATVHTASAETAVVYSLLAPAGQVAALAAAGADVTAAGVLTVTCNTRGGVDAVLACGASGCTCA